MNEQEQAQEEFEQQQEEWRRQEEAKRNKNREKRLRKKQKKLGTSDTPQEPESAAATVVKKMIKNPASISMISRANDESTGFLQQESLEDMQETSEQDHQGKEAPKPLQLQAIQVVEDSDF